MTRPLTTVVFGGPSPEHDISILTGLQVARVLHRAGRPVQALYWAKAAGWHLVDPGLEAADFLGGVPAGAEAVELVVGSAGGAAAGFRRAKRRGRGRGTLEVGVGLNCCHGGPGEDGRLQGLFELARIPYTGCGPAASALGMDKLAFGALVSAHGITTLPRAVLTPETTAVGFDGPYLVKPRFGGSSIGIEAVADLETARALVSRSAHLRAGAVVEPYRSGATDLNIGIRTHPVLDLSAIERPLRDGSRAIYSYDQKYLRDGGGGPGLESAPRELPARIPDDLAGRIREHAREVAGLVGLAGISRLDFLLDGGDLFVNEVNTVPGAMGLYLWAEPEVEYVDLLDDLVAEAAARPVHLDSSGADGAALASAGRIAAKLA